MRATTTIPAGIVPGIAEDAEVEVDIEFSPGSPAQTCGPPESCDPGEGPEIDSVEATLDGKPFPLDADQDSAVTEWLYSHFDFDDVDHDDGRPDADDLRDRAIDDRLTGHDA